MKQKVIFDSNQTTRYHLGMAIIEIALTFLPNFFFKNDEFFRTNYGNFDFENKSKLNLSFQTSHKKKALLKERVIIIDKNYNFHFENQKAGAIHKTKEIKFFDINIKTGNLERFLNVAELFHYLISFIQDASIEKIE